MSTYKEAEAVSTIDKRYYEATELDMEDVWALARRIAERTKSEPHGGPWLLTTRRLDEEIHPNGKYQGDYWSITYYHLRSDGKLVKHRESHTDTVYKQDENRGEETEIEENDVLLFDFSRRLCVSENRDHKLTRDDFPSDEVIVPWKGFGMKSLLYALLSQPVTTKEKAELGDAVSQQRLGVCYFYGAGIKQDFKEAIRWFQKAAKQGDAKAQYFLGRCYQYGCGLTQDLERAKQWYGDAAKQGHKKAQIKLDQNLRW